MNQQNQIPPAPRPGQHYGPAQMPPIPPAKSGMAIAGFVLGLIAILTSFLPIINNLSFLLAILGLVFGTIGFVGITKGKKSGRGIRYRRYRSLRCFRRGSAGNTECF